MQLVVVLYKLFLLLMQPLPDTHVSSVSTLVQTPAILLVTGTKRVMHTPENVVTFTLRNNMRDEISGSRCSVVEDTGLRRFYAA